jgi:thioredoxin reductase
VRRADVAVIGAGPAGIGAALAAARAGAAVVLIDEQPRAGGHLRWTMTHQPGFDGELSGLRGFEIAARLAGWLASSRVELALDSIAWGLFEDSVVGVAARDGAYQLRAPAIVVAAGATDVVDPFPGWELPGVMTATAVQRFMHLHRVLPGRKVVVAGDGAWANEVAGDLRACGAEIVARAAGSAALSAYGAARVELVTIDGSRHAADCVVLACGRQPDPQLALQAQVAVGYSALDGVCVPLRTRTLETTVASLYVAGSAAGACTAAEAYAEGTVAGIAATSGAGLEEALARLELLRTAERAAELRRLQPGTLAGA